MMVRKSWVSSAVAAVVLLLSSIAAQSQAPVSAPGTLINTQLLQLTNQIRRQHDLAPFTENAQLDEAAAQQAADMARRDTCSHLNAQGQYLAARLSLAGYTNFTTAAEDVAAGQPSPSSVLDAWLASPPHRMALLNPAYTEIGLGFALNHSGVYQYYWVEEFGHRPHSAIASAIPFSSPPSGAHFQLVSTEQQQAPAPPPTNAVNISLAPGASSVGVELRMSDDGQHWSEWKPADASLLWKPTAASRTHTIFLQVRAAGAVQSASVTIRQPVP
ncbi:MAG: hypothetical protein KGJ62_03010 [Armatimonadetes bacterium]|nr:hypothetical protein [Armatimonadota bacterium]MDE2207181.1 hypothetical protein [Armatimonadota bacterium]